MRLNVYIFICIIGSTFIFGFLLSYFYGYHIKNILKSQFNRNDSNQNIKYLDVRTFQLEGVGFQKQKREMPYDRLPLSIKENVNRNIWNHSNSSAGIAINFKSNSPEIWIRWKIASNNRKSHMTDIGTMGIDLYAKDKEKEKWNYIYSGIPKGKTNCQLIAKKKRKGWKEYKVYLPLYTRLVSLEIGIDTNSSLEQIGKEMQSPYVFYGTSITQGACVSRPGLAYTNIISRELNHECINLGFSASGKMELEIAKLISDLNPSLVVIDCLPNMDSTEIVERVIPFVELLNKKHKDLPIVLVEWFASKSTFLFESKIENVQKLNNLYRLQFDSLVKLNYKNINYISFEDTDSLECNNWTTDQVHLNDYGSVQYSNLIIKKLEEFNLIIR